jgi:hypothetical protein
MGVIEALVGWRANKPSTADVDLREALRMLCLIRKGMLKIMGLDAGR